MKFKFEYFSFLTVFLFFTGTTLSAQNIDLNSEATTSLNKMGGIGEYYFLDPTGLRIALEGIGVEGTIDKDSYKLGPNDVLSVRIETTQNILFRGVPVNVSGEVVLPSIGPVDVNALTVREAEMKIAAAGSTEYKSPKVSISVEAPHPINVHVSGPIPSPGKYVLPAQSRLDLALLLATNPGVLNTQAKPIKNTDPKTSAVITTNNTERFAARGTDSESGQVTGEDNVRNNNSILPGGNGLMDSRDFVDNAVYSYRNILITHKDGTQTNADLMGYLRGGKLEANPIIRDGDVILIKRISNYTPTVSISGAVNSSYEMEYKPGDTPADLLAIGGGFDTNADTSKIFIYRYDENGTLPVELAPNRWHSYELSPNDRVIVPYDRTRTKTASAWILGEIGIPGNFPISDGKTTVRELLELSGGVTQHALPKGAYLTRGGWQENEIPNKFNPDVMLRTSDQLLEEQEYFRYETRLSMNKVFLNLNNPDQLEEITLFDGDLLFVPRNEHTIFVFGQVNKPGYFPYSPSNPVSVSDYIKNAGGFALAAEPSRIFVLKAGTGTWYRPDETTLESGDRIFVDRVPQESLTSKRTQEFQLAQLKNQRFQLLLAGISTITGIITTYVALTR